MTLERLGGRFRFEPKGRRSKNIMINQTEDRIEGLRDSSGFRLEQKGQKRKKKQETRDQTEDRTQDLVRKSC